MTLVAALRLAPVHGMAPLGSVSNTEAIQPKVVAGVCPASEPALSVATDFILIEQVFAPLSDFEIYALTASL